MLIELMRKATTIGDSIAVQQQLSQNQEQIEQLDGQRRALADQTTFATLTVSVTPLGAPPAADPESSTTIGTAWDDARRRRARGDRRHADRARCAAADRW